jgi:hypothetical protein
MYSQRCLLARIEDEDDDFSMETTKKGPKLGAKHSVYAMFGQSPMQTERQEVHCPKRPQLYQPRFIVYHAQNSRN